MKNEKLIHDWMVSHLRSKLSRDYNEIKVNSDDEKNEFNGHYPDLILGNHGMVLAIMVVETESTVTSERAEEWKALAGLGAKLILMLPKSAKARVVDLLWKQGLADTASVGTYVLNVSMP